MDSIDKMPGFIILGFAWSDPQSLQNFAGLRAVKLFPVICYL
jgi:hypothetical protein